VIPRRLFDEEHEIFRETVRRFVASEITPYHAQWEKDGVVPRALWRKAGAAGLLLTATPEEYGGMGGDFRMSLVVLEELGLAGATGPFFNLHSDIVAPYVVPLREPTSRSGAGCRRWRAARSSAPSP